VRIGESRPRALLELSVVEGDTVASTGGSRDLERACEEGRQHCVSSTLACGPCSRPATEAGTV
jgi:hypothetical protein